MKKILNLTQHAATPEQLVQGVVDLSQEGRQALASLLTFDEIPEFPEMENRASEILRIAVGESAKFAMIGGAPFFMSVLEKYLRAEGISPLYAFSKRESSEKKLHDGSVQKINIFRHVGFVGGEK